MDYMFRWSSKWTKSQPRLIVIVIRTSSGVVYKCLVEVRPGIGDSFAMIELINSFRGLPELFLGCFLFVYCFATLVSRR